MGFGITSQNFGKFLPMNTDGCEKIFFSFFLNKTDKNEELKKKTSLRK